MFHEIGSASSEELLDELGILLNFMHEQEAIRVVDGCAVVS
jgi:hypothetical protein